MEMLERVRSTPWRCSTGRRKATRARFLDRRSAGTGDGDLDRPIYPLCKACTPRTVRVSRPRFARDLARRWPPEGAPRPPLISSARRNRASMTP